MNSFDQIATRLQPYRKRLVAGTFVSFVLFPLLPLLVSLAVGQPSPRLFLLSSLVPMFGFTWLWGLLCIAYWYAPGKGPVSLEVLRQRHWLIALYGRVFRVVAPAFLLVWFLSPVIVVVLFAFTEQ